MGTSYKRGKKEIKKILTESLEGSIKILDVGPGQGTYIDLMKDHFKNWDACEVFEPYIEKFDLKNKYDNVYNMCVTEFEDFSGYDLVIMGDILEHLSVEDSKELLYEKMKDVKQIMIAVPYECPQNAINGNHNEIHLQPDLTREVFEERYPGFELVILMHSRGKKKEFSYGYYVREGSLGDNFEMYHLR